MKDADLQTLFRLFGWGASGALWYSMTSGQSFAEIELLATVIVSVCIGALVELCQIPLEEVNEMREINLQNWSSEVTDSDRVVLVAFTADWCGPCQRLHPVLEQLSQESDEYVIGRVNVDQNRLLRQEHRIQGYPTMLFFKNGREVERAVGYRDRQTLHGILVRLARLQVNTDWLEPTET